MANADGSVIIRADIDDKQAQKELNALTKKIDALQEKLNSKKATGIFLQTEPQIWRTVWKKNKKSLRT